MENKLRAYMDHLFQDVPNTKKADYYSKQGGIITNSNNIFKEIDKLKKGEFNKILVVNYICLFDYLFISS